MVKDELTLLENLRWINLQDLVIKMKRAKNIFNIGCSAKLHYDLISDNQKQCHLAIFLPISGVKPYRQDTIYFSQKGIWWM